MYDVLVGSGMSIAGSDDGLISKILDQQGVMSFLLLSNLHLARAANIRSSEVHNPSFCIYKVSSMYLESCIRISDIAVDLQNLTTFEKIVRLYCEVRRSSHSTMWEDV
jgi:hypothetical protein